MSLLLIVVYISVRFQWKYSIGVLVALAHDVVITVGVYALTGREVSTATVAAILTVLGYSIYDTIIIFDRIRENVPLMRRASFRVIGNVSLWEVLPRSLATTFITLLPVASLYFFGGDTLKDFAFALLVGIGFGAYSSIFLAAPLVAVFKEREPEFARRRDDLGALEGVESIGGMLLDELDRRGRGEEDERRRSTRRASTRPCSDTGPRCGDRRARRSHGEVQAGAPQAAARVEAAWHERASSRAAGRSRHSRLAGIGVFALGSRPCGGACRRARAAPRDRPGGDPRRGRRRARELAPRAAAARRVVELRRRRGSVPSSASPRATRSTSSSSASRSSSTG